MKQSGLDLPLAGTVADVRNRLEAEAGISTLPMFTCMCCGARYRRGEWRCCAPPGGMNAQAWMRLAHRKCPNPDPIAVGPGESRCRRHCRCERSAENNLPIPPVVQPGQDPPIAVTKAVVEELKAAAASGRRSTPPLDPADPFLQSELPPPRKMK